MMLARFTFVLCFMTSIYAMNTKGPQEACEQKEALLMMITNNASVRDMLFANFGAERIANILTLCMTCKMLRQMLKPDTLALQSVQEPIKNSQDTEDEEHIEDFSLTICQDICWGGNCGW